MSSPQDNLAHAGYPTKKSSPFNWLAPHLADDGISLRFPPRKTELRRPLLWLVSTNQQAWLVNLCAQSLPLVTVSRSGLGGGDESPCGYSASEDWVYQNVPPQHCVLVDEWDEIFASDFYLHCGLSVIVPEHGEIFFRAGGSSKGQIDTQVLFWDSGEKGIRV